MYSDSEVFSRFPNFPMHQPHHHHHHPDHHRHHMRQMTISPDKDIADSDLESTASITSAMSTQSERPRGVRRFRYPCHSS